MDALDDSGSAKHAGYEDKVARRRRRQTRLAKAGKSGGLAARARVAADPEYAHSFPLHYHIVIDQISFQFLLRNGTLNKQGWGISCLAQRLAPSRTLEPAQRDKHAAQAADRAPTVIRRV